MYHIYQIIPISNLWDATIRSINEQHKLKPLDFLIATGDHTDTDLENELRWFIEIADGYISSDYFDRTGKKEMAPISPVGIASTLPWYPALGNHDVMYQGSVNNELLFERLKLYCYLNYFPAVVSFFGDNINL